MKEYNITRERFIEDCIEEFKLFNKDTDVKEVKVVSETDSKFYFKIDTFYGAFETWRMKPDCLINKTDIDGNVTSSEVIKLENEKLKLENEELKRKLEKITSIAKKLSANSGELTDLLKKRDELFNIKYTKKENVL